MPSPPRRPPPIVYDLPTGESAETNVQALVSETAAKHAARAARFGTPVRPVSELDVIGARRASMRTGFVSGFDPATQAALMEKRAARFGVVETKKETEEEEKLKQKRRERFGAVPKEEREMYYRSDPLERRRDVAVGEMGRENVMHVFGVDELSTRDVLQHFREYGPSWVEWLNDSSCNVAFEDEFSMIRALRGMAAAKEVVEVVGEAPPEKMDDGEGAGSVGVGGEGVLDERFVWRVGKPIERGGNSLPVWIRGATEKDRRPERPNPKSKWSRNVLAAKKKEGQSLKVSTRRREIGKERKSRPSLDRPLSAS